MLLGFFYKVISLISLISGSLLTGTTFLRIMEDKDFNLLNDTVHGGGHNVTLVTTAKRLLSNLDGKYSSKDAFAKGKEGIDFDKKWKEVNFTAIIGDAKNMWEKLEPYLATSEGISLFVAIIQVIVAFILIMSDVQLRGANRSRHFSRVWNTHYLILGVVLLGGLLMPVYLSNTESKDLNYLIEYIKLLPSVGSEDLEFVSNSVWFYSFVVIDACVLILLGIVTCCLSNRLQAK